ncbi:MAG: hypothetical protein M1831_006357 [Alyxoria varia]|nr:MAG: hypothetical protein M1831_006357 [Alyxoria varia]
MAFQQPIARPARRSLAPPSVVVEAQKPKVERLRTESQEWVLFSPDLKSGTHEQATSLQTPRTAARSRLSDFGSLETDLVSAKQEDNDQPAPSQCDNETEDLDSLDDGLHAFHSVAARPTPNNLDESAIDDTVLPSHDGFGTFATSNSPVQRQFWQHERLNPRRRRLSLRRSNILRRQEALGDIECLSKDERHQRIEHWRMDQSRAIIEEIERQSRRRRRLSMLSAASNSAGHTQNRSIQHPSTTESTTSVLARRTEDSEEPQSLYGRVTRCLIRDILGLDDTILSYIFGEALPEEDASQIDQPSIPDQPQDQQSEGDLQLMTSKGSWEEKLVALVARELGHLVHRLVEHPGAFTTYLQTQQPLPYAGLPSSSGTTGKIPEVPLHSPIPSKEKSHVPTSPSFEFQPTLKHRQRRTSSGTVDPSLFGIDERQQETPKASNPLTESARLQHEKQYWEQNLDVKLVFSFIRDRFITSARSHSHKPSNTSTTCSTPRPAPSTHPRAPSTSVNNSTDSLRRAALIKHQHPLVSRNLTSATSAASIPRPSPILGRRHNHFDEDTASSCASQSTKRSKTRHSGSLSLGSSRNYWDLGGGSGSLDGMGGLGLGGTWGEV